MVLVCVPIPGKESVKSAEHVSDVDADYNPPPLPFQGKQMMHFYVNLITLLANIMNVSKFSDVW